MGILSHLPVGPSGPSGVTPPLEYPYLIPQSARFSRSGSDAASPRALYKTYSATTDAQRQKWVYSTWLKRTTKDSGRLLGSGGDVSNNTYIGITSGALFEFWHRVGASAIGKYNSPEIFRDHSSFAHIFFKLDTTQAISSNRARLWINGIESAMTEEVVLAQNSTPFIGSNTYAHSLGSDGYSLTLSNYDGYLAETHFLAGNTGAAATDFGTLINDVWVPIEYTGGAYGTNGFYFDYSNNTHYGEDQSGNGNDFTDENFGTADQFVDTPTNKHCTFSAINYGRGVFVDEVEPLDGGLYLDGGSSGDAGVMTFPLPASGIWEWSVTAAVVDSGQHVGHLGVTTAFGEGLLKKSYGPDGQYYNGTSWAAYGDSYAADDVIVTVCDVDNGTIHFWKNGIDQGEAEGGLNLEYAQGYVLTDAGDYDQIKADFTDFTLTTEGSLHLNANNLPLYDADLYHDGRKGFNTLLYTGTGSKQDVTGLDFQPGMVWIKNRAGGPTLVVDSARGGDYYLDSTSDAAEAATGAVDKFTFNSDGFTTGDLAAFNTIGAEFVAWCWNKTPDYGFDIVPFTGTGAAHTIPHNLGKEPEMIIIKSRDDVLDWPVYGVYMNRGAIPEQYVIYFNSDATQEPDATIFNNTAPTDSVFTVGTGDSVNKDDSNFVAYLFTSIPNFSYVHQYIGDSSAASHPPYVSCGFKPQFVLTKNQEVALTNWVVFDKVRDEINPIELSTHINTVLAEVLTDQLVFNSDGFWAADSGNNHNDNGEFFISLAYSRQPFKFNTAAR